MTRLRRRLSLRSQAGISLIEMITSIAVLGIFFAAFATVISSSIRHGSEIQEQAVLQTEARAAIDVMVGDLRQSTIAGDSTLGTRVSTATSTQLTFLSPDRLQPMHLRRISYQVSGGKLQRAIATSTATAAPWGSLTLGPWSNVVTLGTTATPVFTYYDAAGAATTVAANVKTVRIRVSVAAVSAPTRLLTYDTRVALRPVE